MLNAKIFPLLLALLLILAVFFGVRSSMLAPVTQQAASEPAGITGAQRPSNAATPTDAVQAMLIERLNALGFDDVSLQSGHKPGWYAASTHQGLYYIDQSGNFLVVGQWFHVSNPDAVSNLTEQTNARMRVAQLSQQRSSALVYGDPEATYQVSVFTDHTCGYCRRMHQVLDEYLAADIAIHYYAFPRAGMQSQGAEQLASIWCADDGKAVLDRAKLSGDTDGLEPPSEACTRQVADHLQMGRAMGVQGTPAMVLPDGRLLTGFRSAEALIAEIEKNL